jgi:hypothetical protein
MLSTQSYGQKAGEAMIYCRDGSVYRGKIIREDEEVIQIVDFAKDTLQIAKTRVKKIKKSEDYLFHSNGKMHDIKGYFWSINFGFSAANIFTSENLRSEHLEFLFGWRFNKRWSVATGIGSEFNFSQVGGFPIETTFTSLFLYGRYYVTDYRRRLFAYSRLGVGFVPTEEIETNVNNTGGIQWQGGGGIHFSSRKHARFIISLGYYLQKANGIQFFLDDFGNEVKIDYNLLITRPILKVGIELR